MRLRSTLSSLSALLLAAAVPVVAASGPAAASVPDAAPCSTSGSWRTGEFNVYWFDVEQGDAQLVIGPTGRTLLIDLGERAWNSKGTGTSASRVAAQIREICGTGSAPVHLDHVMASHHHLDHIGYAGVPDDTQEYGNGLYQLLTPAGQGGLGFTVGQVVDRDGGTWTDANGDGNCDVGTASDPAPEVEWHNVGTTSQTARRWICWLYGPKGQPDRAHIEGKVVRLSNDMAAWPTLDLGGGAVAEIVQANAKGVLQADGETPVSGDHSTQAVPPSENDYSVGVRLSYGAYSYATAGDSDGEYNTATYGYTYNDIESSLIGAMGDVETVRANHHGSGHSSSANYVNLLAPETSVISCGANSYGHPSNRALDAYRSVGADIYLTNNPCDTIDNTGDIDYSGTLNANGTIHLATIDGGAGYTVDYDQGTRTYASGPDSTDPQPDPSQVRINEVFMAPSDGTTEWVEFFNPTGLTVDLGGLYLDDVAGGGGSPKQIPTGALVAPGGRWVFEFPSGFLNNTGTEAVRFISGSAAGATVYDEFSWSLSSTTHDEVLHRAGDGGEWCTATSTEVTRGTPNPLACGNDPAPDPTPTADPTRVRINEVLMAPSDGGLEWVEFYNPTSVEVDLSGLYLDDVAGGGGAPKQIPTGAVVPAGGRWVFEFSSGFLNNTGSESVRYLSDSSGTVVYDEFAWSLGSTQHDKVFHRVGDGGDWCTSISTAVSKGGTNPSSCP